MARYLTPSKIGLLVLIELYTEGSVLATSTIAILSFIISKLLPASLPKPQNRLSNIPCKAARHAFVVSVEDFQELLIQHQSTTIPGRSLWDLFLEKLWKIDSLDAVHSFFESRSEFLSQTREQSRHDTQDGTQQELTNPIRLSRNSPFGAFVRRAQLEFTRLQFEDALGLWKNFVIYRHATLPMWHRRNSRATICSFDEVLNGGKDEWEPNMTENLANVAYGDTCKMVEDGSAFVSTDDVEKLLEFQIDQMQKLGNRVPEAVQNQFQNIMNNNIIIPSLSHYVKFLDAWRAGDYPTSFDNLHRFFDYTMQTRDRLFYQYALLNLAVLQADFGCYHEAIAAIEETIATARENKDLGCLNFGLSWLYHFGKTHAAAITDSKKTNMLGIEREGLAFLRIKAKESAMWSLWSSTLLTEAKMGLSKGESISTAFENIVRSSHLSVSKNMMNNVGGQMMLQSSLWTRLGVTNLATSYCDVFLLCYSRHAPFDDILKFTARSACQLADKGDFMAAITKLDALDKESLQSLKTKQYWLRFRGVIRLKQYLHRDLLDEADELLSQLLSSQDGDADLTFELHMLHIDALTRRGHLVLALERVDELATASKARGDDFYYRVKLLVMRASLLDKCGRPQRGFSVAVRAANIAWKARLLPVLWHAMGVISNILNSLKEYRPAVRILTAVLPRTLETEDCAVVALLFGWLGDAYMGMAKQAYEDKEKMNTYLRKALGSLGRAFDEYSTLQDVKGMCEMTAKKAMILRCLGDVVSSEESAAQYRVFKRKAFNKDN